MANNTNQNSNSEFDMRQSEETWSNFIKLSMWTLGATLVTVVLLAIFVV